MVDASLTYKSSCLDDVDDEVRDRDAFYSRVFKEKLLADIHVREGRRSYALLVTDISNQNLFFSLTVLEVRASSRLTPHDLS